MHGILIEKVKPCSMHMQIFHFTVRGMPTYGREREYFLFVVKTKKIPKQLLLTNQIQRQETHSKLIFFLKAIKRVRISFPKRKTTSILHAYALYFFDFS